MYLTEIDNKTGLIKTELDSSGVFAINEFRDVLNSEELGLKCFTSIALTVDYLSPLRYFNKKERHMKAMETVCDGNRNAFVWNQELIQKCLIKYDEIQYNPDIEEKQLLDSMLIDKLNEIRDTVDAEDKITLFKQLNTIKDLISNFNKSHEDHDIYDGGIIRNGYKLSRLEQKAIDKNSFYNKK